MHEHWNSTIAAFLLVALTGCRNIINNAGPETKSLDWDECVAHGVARERDISMLEVGMPFADVINVLMPARGIATEAFGVLYEGAGDRKYFLAMAVDQANELVGIVRLHSIWRYQGATKEWVSSTAETLDGRNVQSRGTLIGDPGLIRSVQACSVSPHERRSIECHDIERLRLGMPPILIAQQLGDPVDRTQGESWLYPDRHNGVFQVVFGPGGLMYIIHHVNRAARSCCQ